MAAGTAEVNDWETVGAADDWETVSDAPAQQKPKPAPTPQAEQPSALSRFVSAAKEMIPNPVAIAQEYANRPSQWAAVSEVLGTKRGSPEEKAALEKHKDAALSSPVAHTMPMGLEPVAAATEKAMRGDYAGAAGNLAGVGAVAAGLRYTPGVVRAGAKASANALEKSATKNYRSVLLPSAKKLVPKAEKTAAELAKQKPVALTREGLMKQMDAQKAEYGPQAARAYEGKPSVDPAPILNALEELRAKKVTVKGTGVAVSEPLDNAINGLRAKIEEMRGPDGRISPVALDDFKDKLFSGSVDATGQLRQVAPQTAKSIEQGLAGRIKGNLDEQFPDAKKINESYSTAKSAGDFLEDARRREVAAQSGIITGSSQGFGALTQRMLPRPIRQVPQRIAGAFDSTAWNTASGAAKQSLAETLRGGTPGAFDRFMFGEPRRPQTPATPPPMPARPDVPVMDAGPVPKGPHSAYESAQVFAQDPMPTWPVFKSAEESASVFQPPPATQMFNRPRPLAYPPDAGPAAKGPQIKSAEESARAFLDAEIKDAGPVPKGPRTARESMDVFKSQAQKRIEVPQTGIPENIARTQAAREELSRQLTGKRWEELSNPERIRIDDLIAEGNVGAPSRPPMPPMPRR